MCLDAGTSIACSHTLVFDYHLVNGTAHVGFQSHVCQQVLSLVADETYCLLLERCTALRPHAFSAGPQWG